MRVSVSGGTIELLDGDITEQQVDALVNAANGRLAGGGGVDGAIHRKGGPSIMEETNRRYPEGCATGSAVLTGAGKLPARFVLHAVGPIYHDGKRGEPELLGAAHRRCLELAMEQDCKSVAFPAISTGVYGYPVPEAARVALTTVIDFLREHQRPSLVRFVLFGRSTYQVFADVLRELVPEDRV